MHGTRGGGWRRRRLACCKEVERFCALNSGGGVGATGSVCCAGDGAGAGATAAVRQWPECAREDDGDRIVLQRFEMK